MREPRARRFTESAERRVPRLDRRPWRRLELPPGQIFRAAVIALLVWASASWAAQIQEVMLMMLLALLLATAIGPTVERLRAWRFTRGMGVLTVYFGMLLAVGIPAYLLIPQVVDQATLFTTALPQRLASLRAYAQNLQPEALQQALLGGLDKVQQLMQSPQAPPQDQIVAAGATVGHDLFVLVTVFVLAFYWLEERQMLRAGLLRMLPPERAMEVSEVWQEMEERLGGWVRGQLILMTAIGVMSGVAYALIGLPNAVLLGVMAGLIEVVPLLGPFLAFAPAVLIALAIDPTHALLTAGAAAVIQQFESNILVPRVMGPAVGISPLTVLIGILVGSLLYGIPGTFIAVPVAAALQVLLAHFTEMEDPRQAASHLAGEEREEEEEAAGVPRGGRIVERIRPRQQRPASVAVPESAPRRLRAAGDEPPPYGTNTSDERR